jgi:peroxiredoxin
LLSDTGKEVAKAYGDLTFTHLFANRVTFVIDKDGIIRHIDEGSDAIDPTGAVQACTLPRKQ